MKKNKTIKALMTWKVKEFEKIPKSIKFYLIVYLVLFAITTYGLIANNLLLSILSILVGFTFFLFEKKEPADMDFAITKKGILVHDELHYYESLENFWIEYEPGGIKEISFKTNQIFNPYIKVPINRLDPSKIRKILIEFLPEEEHKTSWVDLIDKF